MKASHECPAPGRCSARRRVFSACQILPVLLPLAANAVQPDTPVWHANAQSVLELLQADTRRALEGMTLGESAGVPASAPIPVPAAPAADRIELAALYGTAGSLTAILYVNGVRKEYRPGAKLPYAGAGAAGEYRLMRIVDGCVLLKKRNETRTRSACFVPGTDAGVPVHEPAVAVPGSANMPTLGMPLPMANQP